MHVRSAAVINSEKHTAVQMQMGQQTRRVLRPLDTQFCKRSEYIYRFDAPCELKYFLKAEMQNWKEQS